jgi:hypothetical protein
MKSRTIYMIIDNWMKNKLINSKFTKFRGVQMDQYCPTPNENSHEAFNTKFRRQETFFWTKNKRKKARVLVMASFQASLIV